MNSLRLHNLADRAARRCTLQLIDKKYIWICECGKPASEHVCIGSTLGLSATVVIRCADGKLSFYKD